MAMYLKSGGGNWSAAGTWSATGSGGADSVGPPLASTDVILEAGSGAVTIDSGAVCRSINCTSGTGDYNNTITHSAAVALTIGDGTAGAGNVALKFSGTTVYTKNDNATSAISFISTSATQQTINFNSSGTNRNTGNVTFNGASGSWQLTGAMTSTTTASVNLTNGTFDTNGQTCSWGLFSLSSGTKTLTLGGSSITINGSGTAWNLNTNSSGLTFNSNTSNITFSGGGTFAGGGKTYNNVTSTAGLTLSGTNIFNNFTVTGSSGAILQFIIQANQTINGTFTLTGVDSGTQIGRIIMIPSIPSNPTLARTITAAAVSLTNVDFCDVIAAGTSIPWSGTLIGDAGGNSNINFDSPRTIYWVGNGGNDNLFSHWSTSSGGSSGAYPTLPQDTAIVNNLSFTLPSQSVGIARRFAGGTWDFSGVLNNPSITTGSQPAMIFGSLILDPNMSWNTNMTGRFTMAGRGNFIINTNGVNIGNNLAAGAIIEIACPNGTYSLSSDIKAITSVSAASILLSSGTFDANGKNLTLLSGFGGSGTTTRTLNMGSGNWILNGTGTVWNTGTTTGLTLNAQTSTISITDTSSTNKTFTGGGKTYQNLNMWSGGSGIVIFSDANTFQTFTINAPKSVRFTSATTTNIVNFLAKGSSGNVITIDATTPTSAATLNGTGSTWVCDWLSLTDNTGTGNTKYAGANSTLSNVTGWTTGDPPLMINESPGGMTFVQEA